jgi:hypothetical protein
MFPLQPIHTLCSNERQHEILYVWGMKCHQTVPVNGMQILSGRGWQHAIRGLHIGRYGPISFASDILFGNLQGVLNINAVVIVWKV